MASSVDRSWSATDAGRATTRPRRESPAATAAADGAADSGRSVATWAKDAARLAVAAAESDGTEGRDADEDASDTAAAVAEDDVETVDEEDDTAVASLPSPPFPLASPSPSPVPVAMQSRGRSGIWSATGYHFVGYTLGFWLTRARLEEETSSLEWNGRVSWRSTATGVLFVQGAGFPGRGIRRPRTRQLASDNRFDGPDRPDVRRRHARGLLTGRDKVSEAGSGVRRWRRRRRWLCGSLPCQCQGFT